MSTLRTLGWLAAIVYSTIPLFWLLVHPRTEFWRRFRSPLHVLGPIWTLIWVAVGLITAPWRKFALYDTPLGWAAAVPLFAAGVFLYTQSRKHFATDQVIGRAELHPHKHTQKLATEGIRSRVRHPLYLAHLCELLGLALGTGLLVVYVLLAFAVITGHFMLRAEERELEQRFGNEYRAYRRRVPAIIPKLRGGTFIRPSDSDRLR
jgi:protein-S-isoprenylcysteine O-methyltransferase Ste14